ncbi:ribbon-helix-helix protein, CopG family [Thalassomonas viridans]|uniref:Ribbon-helix-helix protein, CopG family n=1 Tax=Thalassomonas viridans TaxID=137584 RepID=A0AAE9Z7T6_9GAMM|nr:ribbon-helix-helix protein, CopG family [Thalassomonas viridans]WDE06677.1 ribbon-helix-helix protein, CopG family [Thalassomonas viridans]
MKKVIVLTVRIDSETGEAIHALAQADDRSVAWVARTLITEALEARKLLTPQDDKQPRAAKS